MSNEQQQIIDEVYRRFCKETFAKNSNLPIIFATDGVSMKDRFIDKCKTDTEFSEKWGLKIEERELSLEERYDWYIQTHNKNLTRSSNQFDMDDILNSNNCPTKLITITYNDIKTEIYE